MKKPWHNTQKKAKMVLKASSKEIKHGLKLHKSLLVCDTFGFDPKIYTQEMVRKLNRMIDGDYSAYSIKKQTAELWNQETIHNPKVTKAYFEAFRESGVTSITQNVGAKGENLSYMTKTIARNICKTDTLQKGLIKALTPKDIVKAKEQGKHSLVFSTNGIPVLGQWEDIDEELEWLRVFWNMGVRMMHLTYNRRNMVGSGCTEREDAGLSDFGRDVIERMNKLGIIVDTAHTGRKSTLDAAKCSKRPIVASHTGADALFHHDRNKTDEEIKAIVKTGGLIGIYTIAGFLGKGANLETMLDHLDYVARLVGVDHVAIATDGCYVSPLPKSPKQKKLSKPPRPETWSNWRAEHQRYASDEASKGSLAWMNWPYFTVGLVKHGYSDRDIEKILSGNFLRVFGENC